MSKRAGFLDAATTVPGEGSTDARTAKLAEALMQRVGDTPLRSEAVAALATDLHNAGSIAKICR